MSNSEILSEMVALRLTPSYRKKLQKLAEERSRDVAELARIIITQWIDSTDKKESKNDRKGS